MGTATSTATWPGQPRDIRIAVSLSATTNKYTAGADLDLLPLAGVDRASQTLSFLAPGSGVRKLLFPNFQSRSSFPQPMHKNFDFATADQQLTAGFPLL